MITTQDKVKLLERIVEIENMNLCSTDFVKKVTSPSSTQSDKVLDNYSNNGNVKLENCFICLDRNGISLSGVVEFYSEEFNYRDEDKVGKRFIGYSHDRVKIVENDFALINSIKLFFLVNQNTIKNISINPSMNFKDFDRFNYPIVKMLDYYNFNEEFYNRTIMINWTTFKRICENIPVDNNWTDWFNNFCFPNKIEGAK